MIRPEENDSSEWLSDVYLDEAQAAASERSLLPSPEDVWVGTSRRPILGRRPQIVITRTEAQAKAALLKHWRNANKRCKLTKALEAKAHCILMGLEPTDFPEVFSGLTFPVRDWEDLRVVYGAYVYPVAFGEVFVAANASLMGDIVSDAIAYLEHPDTDEPLW